MNIVFKELIITDIKENVSKRVKFFPKRNLLSSDTNGKGKSTIMKSLYHSLGANASFDDNIDKKAMVFDIRLNYGDNEYRIVRFVDLYLIFKNHKLELSCKYGNISELSEYYKKEFGMYVYLKDRMGGLPIAPPAYSFIPYYLDQDYSWKKEQMPFDNLWQYEKLSRNDLYYYHLSIFTDEYNATKSKYKEQQLKCDLLDEEVKQLYATYMQLKDQIKVEAVCIDDKEIEILINYLSNQINERFNCFNNIKNEMFVLENEKVECVCQIESIDKGINELTNKMKTPRANAKCPNCGTEFEVDIEKDIKELYNKTFLQNRRAYYISRIDEINKELAIKKERLEKYTREINELEARLKSEQANYDAYMRRKVSDGLFRDMLKKIGELNVKREKELLELKRLKNTLDSFDVKTDKIKVAFKSCYINNLLQLNVKKFNSEKIKAFNKLAIGGSQYVRSTLAFFYSFIELKKEFNKDKFQCPLIIDSPREGEQDDMNSQNILKFIFDKYDGEEQLIVASVNGDKYINVVDSHDEINIIKLDNDDNQVMTKQGYQENLEAINEVKSYLGLN